MGVLSMIPRSRRLSGLTLAALIAAGAPAAARASALCADLDGDAAVVDADASLLAQHSGNRRGDLRYDPAADLDAADAARLGAALGSTGEPDTRPPRLRATLEHIPDGMKQLIVVPPERFRITLAFDADGGSPVDPGSLAVHSDRDMGPFPRGVNLAPAFDVSPTGAIWEIPAGFDLDHTTHHLTISVRDRAGNEATEHYGFAVRDFAFGPPLGRPQLIFLDFERDRGLGPLPDFVEDLRRFGLSSGAAPGIEAQMLALSVRRILEKMHRQYGRNADGSEAQDSVNVSFYADEPEAPHSRLCVGGESAQGAEILGAVAFDAHNLIEHSDECASPAFGVFPQALDELWWNDPDFETAFAPLDPERGGVPVGEHALDASIFAAEFDPDVGSEAQEARIDRILEALEAFSGAVATAASHEVGHMLGITAAGPAPAGHFGDNLNHNLDPDGRAPQQNFIMNPGSSFSFAQAAGNSDEGLARFRPFNWAYLRDRIAPSELVTGLHPAPVLLRVEPPVAILGQRAIDLRFVGQHFLGGLIAPRIELVRVEDATPVPVYGVALVDRETLRGRIDRTLVSPGVYHVRYVSPDGQVATLKAGLTVR
jgi:hypothetical protein